jgi:ATP-dependent protease ClpP protease subunit
MKKYSNLLRLDSKFKDKISVDKFHNIYFRSSITKKNMMILTRIIQEKNNKYKNLSNQECAKHPINLHITSDGGDTDTGLYAYDILKKSRFPINTFCDGYVCSAGTFLYLAGSKRYITPNSKILIHQLSSSCRGTFNNMEDQMHGHALTMHDMKKLYLHETDLKKKDLDKLLANDISLTAKECLKFGISHYIF